MKKFLLPLLSAASLFLPRIVFAQNPVFPSTAANPASTTFDVNDVNFLNKDTAIAVGSAGLAWQTTDGGLNWTVLSTFTSTVNNNAVYMEDEYICIAGDAGLVTFSKDQGLTWQKAAQAQSNLNYHGVDFADTTFGVSVGDAGDAVVFKWNGSFGWVHIPTGTNKRLNAVATFKTSTNPQADGYAIAVGNHGIVAKYAAGNWSVHANVLPGNIHGVYLFPDNITVLAVGEHGLIARSADFGSTWTILNSGVSETLRDISEGATPNHFITVGDNGVIYVSSDGGNTFTRYTAGFTTSNLKGVSAKNPRGSFGGSGNTLRAFSTDSTSGIHGVNDAPAFVVGPNPATNTIQVNVASEPASTTMRLYDIRSELVYTEKIQRGKNSYDVSALVAGVYFLVIDGRATKIIIED